MGVSTSCLYIKVGKIFKVLLQVSYSPSSNMVYMSAEVSHDWNGQDVTVSAGDIEHIHIQYPNYERHDCEARTICFQIHIIWAWGWEGGRKNN